MKQYKRIETKINVQKGVTLIELMVALVIGLIVSLAVYSVLTANEGRKRTTTSTNDIDQVSAFASYQLDKALRSAGSGFTAGLNPRNQSGISSAPLPSANFTLGCLLKIATSTNTLAPKSAAFPAPFASAPVASRLAPVVILDEAATRGDVLIAMSGSGGLSESITNLTATPSASGLTLANLASFTATDKLLLLGATTDSNPVAGTPCLLEQAATTFSPGTGTTFALGLDTGTDAFYVNPTGYSSITATGIVLNLGRAPSFNLFGVGANNTLFKYDMLLPADTSATSANQNPSEFAESVYSMQAIYGVGATPGSLVWTAPIGTYSSANLLNGTAAANLNLRNIKAVRVALVMRTNLLEKEVVSPSTINVFESTGTATTLSVTLGDTHYRYRVVESTIPIRNALALN